MIRLLKTAGIQVHYEAPLNKLRTTNEGILLLYDDFIARASLSGKIDAIQSAPENSKIYLSNCSKYMLIPSPNSLIVIEIRTKELFSFDFPIESTEIPQIFMDDQIIILIANSTIYTRTLLSPDWSLPQRQTTHQEDSVANAVTFFCHDDYIHGKDFEISQTWLKKPPNSEYFLETTTTLFSSSNNELISRSEKSIRIHVDYDTQEPSIFSKYDSEGSLQALVLNSTYPVFTQILLINSLSSSAKSYKISNFIFFTDIPSRTQDGKGHLWVDDLAWSPNNQFIAVLLKYGYLCVLHRGSQPFTILLSIQGCIVNPSTLSFIPFSTDPALHPGSSQRFSVDWGDYLALSDGFTINLFALEGLPLLDELVNMVIAHNVNPEVAIGLSHLTKSLPTDHEDNKAEIFDNIIMLLRSSWSRIRNSLEEKQRFSLLSEIEGTFQVTETKQEITYINLSEYADSLDSSKFLNNIVLSKRMSVHEGFINVCKLLELLNWQPYAQIDFYDSCLVVGEKGLKFIMNDGQSVYAYILIRMLEGLLGTVLHKLRSYVLVYSMIQYRNHQASNMNIIYYPIGYKLLRDETCQFIDKTHIDSMVELLNENMVQFIGEAGQRDNQTTFRHKRTTSSYHANIQYLSGAAPVFGNDYQNLTGHLLVGNMQAARQCLSTETLILYAYYLDPTEPYFISPIEAGVLFQMKFENITDYFNELKKLSVIEKQIDDNYRQDAGFIYWVIGVFTHLEKTIGPLLAFHSLSTILPKLSPNEVKPVISSMLAIFEAEILSCLPLLNEKYLDVFIVHGILLVTQKLNECLKITGIAWNSTHSLKPYEDLPLPPKSKEFIEISLELLRYFYFDLTRLSSKEWIRYKFHSQDELEITKKIRKLIRILYKLYCDSLHNSTKDTKYLSKLSQPNWKTDPLFSKFLPEVFKSPCTQREKPKKFIFPTLSESVTQEHSITDQTIKTWNYLNRTLSQEYSIDDIYYYSLGKYTPRATTSPSLRTHFLSVSSGQLFLSTYLSSHLTPLAPSSRRMSAKLHKHSAPTACTHFYTQLACKDLFLTLQQLLHSRYLHLKEQIFLVCKAPLRSHRRYFSSPTFSFLQTEPSEIQFFILSPLSLQRTRLTFATQGPHSSFRIYRSKETPDIIT